MKGASLHIQLLVAAVTLIAAVTFTLDVVVVQITQQFMHKRFTDRITFLAKYLALNSEVGVLINDEKGLKSLAKNLLGEDDVAQVTILDNHNTILVDLKKAVPPPLSLVETPVLFKQAVGENILFNSGTPALRNPFAQTEPLLEETIGKVRIHYSTQGIDQLLHEITWKFVWVSAGLALLGGLLFYLISRAIGKELTQLAVTASHVGLGDLELRASPGRLPEIRAVATSFNNMLDSMEENRKAFERVNRDMTRQKTLAEVGKFSLMVAHEVKNPLAIIKSSLDVLKKEINDASENRMVDYMEDEIRRLNRLIEEFLLFARPVKPTLRQVDLNDSLTEVIQRFQLQYMDTGLNITADIPGEPVETKVDRDLFGRSISNIIKNACEANCAEGDVVVCARAENEWWVVSVADQGDGIDPKNLQRIFDPFFTTRAKGTGLGLAFTKQVIKAHGGMVSAENRDEGGAVFSVKMPVRDNPAPGS